MHLYLKEKSRTSTNLLDENQFRTFLIFFRVDVNVKMAETEMDGV